MKLVSETKDQKADRLRKPMRKFAWFPIRMDDGVVIWLEHYWFAIRAINFWNNNAERTRSLTKEGLRGTEKMKRPVARQTENDT